MRRKIMLALAISAALVARAAIKDETLGLLSEGYSFIPNRSRRHGSDVFETRLMLRKVVCMTGREAAEVFYTPDRFTRRGALPQTTLRLLQDFGSVQTLDGEAHRRRKRMFMSLMNAESLRRLADVTDDEWRARARGWESADTVVLHDEAEEVLCRAVCRWAGVPLAEPEAKRRTREFAEMIEGAGNLWPHTLKGLMLRPRTERWARNIVEGVRAGRVAVDEGSAAHVIALHREANGELLDPRVAAVELINVLRPTVAVARYVTFAALALHEHQECRRGLRDGGDAYLDFFVNEVRRYYPFFPLIGGRVLTPFDWGGRCFAKGEWALLDLYGTNHDSRVWEDPEEFRPERFRRWKGSAFELVPQGGGDHYHDHRCAGEWITIELMRRAVRLLTGPLRYDVPEQDLRIDLSRMPTVPKSRFVIVNARLTG